MELNKTAIYKFIKDYQNDTEIIKFKKDEYIEKANSYSDCIYYILDGLVKMENISRSGNKILVDEIGVEEFAGHISKIRGTCFYCDAISKKPSTLVKIPDSLVYKLLGNDEFAKLFYSKTSTRIYCMYKKLLLERLFSWEEIVSYHILKNSKDGVFIYKSMYDICEQLNISRRGLYNIINKLVFEECLEKKDNIFIIKDKKYLKGLASGVVDFYKSID